MEALCEMNDQIKGQHMLVIAWVEEKYRELLNDSEYLSNMLNDVVSLAGMKVLEPARMVVVPIEKDKADSEQDCGGITGTAILSTSHVSIHTWPLFCRFSFDLYSCKSFDGNKIWQYLKEKLHLVAGNAKIVGRSPSLYLRNNNLLQYVDYSK